MQLAGGLPSGSVHAHRYEMQCKELFMQLAITAMAVAAGMVLSLAIAIFMEELIFGRVFRLFARQAARVRSGQQR